MLVIVREDKCCIQLGWAVVCDAAMGACELRRAYSHPLSQRKSVVMTPNVKIQHRMRLNGQMITTWSGFTADCESGWGLGKQCGEEQLSYKPIAEDAAGKSRPGICLQS